MINLYQFLKNYPDFSRQLSCKDLLFTQYDCPQTERKERFYLECNNIVYVISGKRIFHKNRKTWDLCEGVCAFIKKGTHISEIENGEGWCVMSFFIPDDFLKHLVNENLKTLPLANLPEANLDHILPLNVNDLSKSFFASMLPYFTQTPPPPEHLLELKFKELVLSLLSNQENRRFLSYLHNLYNDQHLSMEDIMQNNYTFNLTLADYAKLANKSVPTFQRDFKKIFNNTPAKWVKKKRLNLATELLENTTQSIGEITYECGFENQTHFSRIFKEKMGTSPLQFRMNFQAASITNEV
ncbi:MAG TPA: AraC family transcriptional regulator [Ferruginibacter sp.]|nr:AraC family transcriptional regulator [Ferruginibacter sp.]